MNQVSELSKYPVGTIIAKRYEVIAPIGEGAMGVVLKAKDLVLDGEIIALKILLKEFVKDQSIFARFRREVLLTRRLAHPHIVRLYDFGDSGDGTYFLTMEFVEGESLAARIKKGKLDWTEASQFLYQIAMGVGYAHSQGVVHRDIKPANILITTKGEIKITDFGVARSLDSKDKLTRTDEAVGSPVYMCPEQLTGAATGPDSRSDIYALGIMAYELVVGELPFFSENWVILVRMHVNDPMPVITYKVTGVPFWFQILVNKAAAKEAKDRYQNANEFANVIAEHYDVWKTNTANALVPRVVNQKFSGSSLVLIGLLVIAIILIVVILFN